MARNYSNIAVDTTLTAGINGAVTSMVVASATGWPAAPFAAVLDPGLSTEEVVQVTAKVGTTFTITRGFDGTSASAHALGAVVRHAAIAGDFTDLQAADATNAAAIATESATRAADDLALAGLIATETTNRQNADALLTPMARTLTINGVAFDLSANRSWTVTGGVSGVTASAPLASSGGATPDISLTGLIPLANGGSNANMSGTAGYWKQATAGTNVVPVSTIPLADIALSGLTTGQVWRATGAAAAAFGALDLAAAAAVTGLLPAANGGTGVNNAGTLTNASNTTITGGGTLALGGFTLTVPATGTAALLAVGNAFTAGQTITTTASSSALTCSTVNGTAGVFTTTTGAPSVVVRSTAASLASGINDLLQLDVRVSGAASNGFGMRTRSVLKSSTTSARDAGASDTLWADATDATRKARRIESVGDATTLREYLRAESDGTNPMIGFLGAAASARTAITGSRGGNAALANLLTELATKGLITDSTTA